MDIGTLGSIFGGLSQGLAQGAEAGISLSQKQEQIDLQKEHGKLQAIQLLDHLDKWSPEARKLAGASALKLIFKQIGVDPAQMQPAIDIFVNDKGGEQKTALLGFFAKTLQTSPESAEKIFQGMTPMQMIEVGSKLSSAQGKIDLRDYRRDLLDARERGALDAAARRDQEVARREERQKTVSHAKIVGKLALENSLNSQGRANLIDKLEIDKSYQSAKEAGQEDLMYDIAQKHATEIAKDFSTKPDVPLPAQAQIRTYVEGLYKSPRDPITNEFRAISGDKSKQDVIDEATRIYKEGGGKVTISTAVQQATRNTTKKYAPKAPLTEDNKYDTKKFRPGKVYEDPKEPGQYFMWSGTRPERYE